jgi:hypothetical protein
MKAVRRFLLLISAGVLAGSLLILLSALAGSAAQASPVAMHVNPTAVEY